VRGETDITLTITLDRAAVEALSKQANEPAWLRELRVGAFDRFEKIAEPTDRTEGWRRLSFESADLAPAAPEPTVVRFGISDEQRALGVVAMPLSLAATEHEPMVRDALAKPRVGHTLAKYSALAQSAWQGGAFVLVPDGVQLTHPISIEIEAGAYPWIVLVIGADARASIIETHRERGSLSSGLVDIAAGAGSRLTYAHVQDVGRSSVAFSHQHARVARGAKLVTLNFGMGARLSKNDVEVELLGQGAESDMLGLVFADGEQQFDYHTLQGHRSPDTRSDLLYKSALNGASHSLYTGIIIIDRGAQRSDAYQANRNLLLSEHARADTEPKLEIEADDVRCTHGATVGPIDDEQLFYLASRGLDPEVGSRLIVEGFFQEVFEKAGDAELVRPLQDTVAPHISRLGAR